MSEKPKGAKKSETEEFKSIVIFSDGACSGNPGPGGWATVVAMPDGKIKELGGFVEKTTNNEMEMRAALEGLKKISRTSGTVDLYTDSVYLIRGITQWIWGWKKRGWKTAEGNAVANQEMWEQLLRVVSARGSEGKINWYYSRGHVGTPGNERCDEIAVAFSKGKWIDLYEGNLLQYPIAIFDLPEDTSLPEMKPKQEKKVAFSYLSNIGGEVYRHKDWASCERRVKGKSGAQFKKAMSAQDESAILSGWGMPTAKVKDSI